MLTRLAALAFVVAGCSSESGPSFVPNDDVGETAPAGSKSPSASASSSSSSPSPASPTSPSTPATDAGTPPAAACVPDGTFVTSTLTVTGDKGFCDAIAKEMAKQPFEAVTVVTTKLDASHVTVGAPNDEPRAYTLEAATCEMKSAAQRTGSARVTDSKGKRIDITFSASSTVAVAGDDATITGVSEVSSPTAGATDFPCKLTTVQTAKRQ